MLYALWFAVGIVQGWIAAGIVYCVKVEPELGFPWPLVMIAAFSIIWAGMVHSLINHVRRTN